MFQKHIICWSWFLSWFWGLNLWVVRCEICIEMRSEVKGGEENDMIESWREAKGGEGEWGRVNGSEGERREREQLGSGMEMGGKLKEGEINGEIQNPISNISSQDPVLRIVDVQQKTFKRCRWLIDWLTDSGALGVRWAALIWSGRGGGEWRLQVMASSAEWMRDWEESMCR